MRLKDLTLEQKRALVVAAIAVVDVLGEDDTSLPFYKDLHESFFRALGNELAQDVYAARDITADDESLRADVYHLAYRPLKMTVFRLLSERDRFTQRLMRQTRAPRYPEDDFVWQAVGRPLTEMSVPLWRTR